MKRSNKWKCLSCRNDTRYEHFFLKDEIWFKVHNSKSGMMCINCIEIRLGRKLNKSDFTDCYINKLDYGSKSLVLLDRLTNVEYTTIPTK